MSFYQKVRSREASLAPRCYLTVTSQAGESEIRSAINSAREELREELTKLSITERTISLQVRVTPLDNFEISWLRSPLENTPLDKGQSVMIKEIFKEHLQPVALQITEYEEEWLRPGRWGLMD